MEKKKALPGASIEKQSYVEKFRRMKRSDKIKKMTAIQVLDYLLTWSFAESSRTIKKVGGRGRR